MRTEEEIKEMVLIYVKNDPLYKVLKDTPQEFILFSDDYLKTIIEKTGYPMLDIAEWFNISDGQLRYYLRPFSDYIYEDDGVVSGHTNNVVRLNIRQILRLRMLILLKEEYRMKGLKQLLGLDGEGFLIQTPNTKMGPGVDRDLEFEELQDEVEKLKQIVTGIIKTGFFRLPESGDFSEIVIDEKNIEERMRMIAEGSGKGIMLVEDVDHIERAKQDLIDREKEIEDRKVELNRIEEETAATVAAVTDKITELDLIQSLRLEGLEKWKEDNRYGLWAKITRADQIDIEKENFLKTYIEKHINADKKTNVRLK